MQNLTLFLLLGSSHHETEIRKADSEYSLGLKGPGQRSLHWRHLHHKRAVPHQIICTLNRCTSKTIGFLYLYAHLRKCPTEEPVKLGKRSVTERSFWHCPHPHRKTQLNSSLQTLWAQDHRLLLSTGSLGERKTVLNKWDKGRLFTKRCWVKEDSHLEQHKLESHLTARGNQKDQAF